MGWVTRLYRLAVVIAIVWLIHDLRAGVRRHEDAPIKVEEVRPFLTAAVGLEPDDSPRAGQHVLDAAGQRIGYALRTSPLTDKITGYVGPTDTLVVLDPELKIIGLKIRSSQDTKEHVGDVSRDEYFMTYWNGKTWDEVAKVTPGQMRIEGTAGATLTSLAIAEGLHLRFKTALAAIESTPAGPTLTKDNFSLSQLSTVTRHHVSQISWKRGDFEVIAFIVVAMLFAFTRLKSVPWARRVFQVALIGYLGFINGQILAQSLLSGWTASSVPWRGAPGLVLLAAAALIIPWASRRQIYCSHLCPHGAAQELAGRLSKKKFAVPRSVDRGLRWLPPLLIALVLFVTMLGLPFNLADIEPFDAYLVFIGSAGVATIAIAVAGLIAAAFVPMAYCKYGCPTGMLLNFVRSHGRADHFGRRDLAAGLMVVFVAAVTINFSRINLAIRGEPPVFKQPSTKIKGMEAE